MDLSRIPEPLRSRLSEQLDALPLEVRRGLEEKLAKLPMDQVEAVLKRTAPLLQKLAAKGNVKVTMGTSAGAASAGAKSAAKGIAAAARTGSITGQAPKPPQFFDPHDHYNNTVQRGDRESPPLFVIMFLVACAVVFLRTLGFLGG